MTGTRVRALPHALVKYDLRKLMHAAELTRQSRNGLELQLFPSSKCWYESRACKNLHSWQAYPRGLYVSTLSFGGFHVSLLLSQQL